MHDHLAHLSAHKPTHKIERFRVSGRPGSAVALPLKKTRVVRSVSAEPRWFDFDGRTRTVNAFVPSIAMYVTSVQYGRADTNENSGSLTHTCPQYPLDRFT